MGSGEAQFFPKTLSLVYGKLVEKVSVTPISYFSGSDSKEEMVTPAENEEGERDRSSAGKQTEGGLGVGVTQTPSVPNTPGPGAADGGPSGEGFAGREERENKSSSDRPQWTNTSWFRSF